MKGSTLLVARHNACREAQNLSPSLCANTNSTIPISFLLPRYAADGVTEMACFPSGNYCDASTFPAGTCSQSDSFPTCKKCPDSCATCLPNGGACTSCKKDFFLVKGGECGKNSNCKGYAEQGLLKQPVTKYRDIDLELALAGGRNTEQGVCLLDDDDRVYEVSPCTALLSDGQTACKQVSTAIEANTCSDAGYMLFTFRNQKHYALMVKAYGLSDFYRYIKTVPVAIKQGVAYQRDR